VRVDRGRSAARWAAAAHLALAGASCARVADSPDRAAVATPARPGSAAPPAATPARSSPTMPPPATPTIARLERVPRAEALGGLPGVEIELASPRPFPALGELATLRIGDRAFTLSRYGDGGMHTLIFTLTPAEADAVADGAPVSVQYGDDPVPAERAWRFGALAKSRLR
jgi:hypothetical protein